MLLAAVPALPANTEIAPSSISAAASPQVGYYGTCDDATPVGVTVRASLDSPVSLQVTLRYRYVGADPRAASSPILSKRMPLQAAGRYIAAIGVSDEASAYLNGADGSLQYQIEAKTPAGDIAQSAPGSVAIRRCSSPSGLTARTQAGTDRR